MRDHLNKFRVTIYIDVSDIVVGCEICHLQYMV
jgi:hypothetical protein